MILLLNREASHIQWYMHGRYQSCAPSFPSTPSSFLFGSFPNLPFYTEVSPIFCASFRRPQKSARTNYKILFQQTLTFHISAKTAPVKTSFSVLLLYETFKFGWVIWAQQHAGILHIILFVKWASSWWQSMVLHKCEGHQDLEHVLLHCYLFYCVPTLNFITTCLVSLSHVTCTPKWLWSLWF
jgi:hypothetical protein